MTEQTKLGGGFTLPGTSITLHRMGYGAMQLAGPGVYGPPRDTDAAKAFYKFVENVFFLDSGRLIQTAPM